MLGQQIRALGNGKFQTPAGVFNTYAEAVKSVTPAMSPALGQTSYGDKLSTMADPNAMAKSDASIQSSPAMPMRAAPVPSPSGLLGDTPTQPQAPQKQGFGDFLKSADGLSGIGAMMLSMSNNERAQALGMNALSKIGEQRKAQDRLNKTVGALRERGRNDIADAVEGGLIDAKTAAGLLFSGAETKVVGNKLVSYNPNDPQGTMKVLVDDMGDDEATTAFRTLQARAEAAGLKEGTPEYTQFMIDGGTKSGFAMRSLPDGGFEFVQGGASLKPLNESQAKATGFYGRMTYLSPIIDKFEQQGTQLFDNIVKGIPLAGNYLTSNEYKQYMYAKDNWIAAQLRDESGAAIGTDEYINADKQYFPQIGDSAEVIEQKRNLRKKAEEAMKTKMGGTADKEGSKEQQEEYVRDPVTGKIVPKKKS